MKKKFVGMTLMLLVLFSGISHAHTQMTKSQPSGLIEDLCEKLEKYYTFPDKGKELSVTVLDIFEKGGFFELHSPEHFVEELNRIFFEISQDKHLKLIHNPKRVKEMKEAESEGLTNPSQIEEERRRNFGFRELRILDGNVGYLNITDFCSVNYAGEKAATAMAFLSDCRSLIIDLRQNGGGNDDMVVFLASYFIDAAEPIVFNISHSTIDDVYYTSMMPSYIPGKKLADIPVYILTSGATASAAEAFINILMQYDKNVVVVGHKTRGAENPVSHVVVGDEYILRIPSWRKIYSSMKTEWEGTGISPHVRVDENKALLTAHLAALKKLMEKTVDKDEISHYQWAYDGLKALNDPISVDEEILRSYAGNYDGRRIIYANGELFYGPQRQRLVPVTEEYFLVESIDYFRIRFIKANNQVIALDRNFVYGYSTRHTRK